VGLVVDEVIDERHVVVNGLGPLLPIPPADRLVSGATLVNEDEVVLILDAPGIAARALVAARSGGRWGNAVGGDSTRNLGPSAPKVSPTEAARQVSVLVVDDSITTRTLEQSILAAAGFRVATAEDGARGLAAARREPPDVIVADVEMPFLDGVEMTRRLKGDPATRDIPIILLTALETPEQQAAGLEAGAEAYLLKSGFDQERLIAAIRGLVG
jgi:two-component system chemotaxis sensor kinase CheA